MDFSDTFFFCESLEEKALVTPTANIIPTPNTAYFFALMLKTNIMYYVVI